MDDEFKNYAEQIKNVVDNIEQYAPMLVIENKMPVYKNVAKEVPVLQSQDILGSLFEARKCGITTYDTNIESFLQINNLDTITKSFLTSEDTLFVDSKQHTFSELKTIINYLTPCLFVIPASRELESVSLVYEFLMSQGYDSSDISIMFRLPSINPSEFNNFVKTYVFEKLINPSVVGCENCGDKAQYYPTGVNSSGQITDDRVLPVINKDVIAEFEILPELVFGPDALRHNVRHLVQRNEHERVGVNELGALFRGVQTERQFFALVFAVSGVFACGQCFAHLLRVKFCY
jgi:hypothetical protein